MFKLIFLALLCGRLFLLFGLLRFGLLRLLLAGGFDALQFLIGFEVRTLQAALELRHTAEDGGAGVGRVFVIARGFENFQTHQLPLGDGRLIDQVLLGRGLGLILALKTGVDLVKVILIFAGQHHGAGAQSVAHRVHGSGGLPLGRFRTLRAARIAPICRGLSLCCHRVTSF